MSNFWAQRLGIQPAQPPAPQPAPMPAVGQPWWAPPPVPMPQVQQPGVQPVPMPQAQQPEQGGWGNEAKSRAKAQSSRLTDVCPGCGSGNVFRPTQNAMLQCYECGENPRFTQSGGGGGLPSDTGSPATPSRQISGGGGAGGKSNFNPQQVIARVGG